MFVNALALIIQSGHCFCGGELEETQSGWRCKACGWKVVRVYAPQLRGEN